MRRLVRLPVLLALLVTAAVSGCAVVPTPGGPSVVVSPPPVVIHSAPIVVGPGVVVAPPVVTWWPGRWSYPGYHHHPPYGWRGRGRW